MPSIEDLIREVSSIKVSSDELAMIVGAANMSLASQSANIAAIVRGSRTGQEAVMALSMAARGLADAASSMKALSRTCDTCIQNLSK